MKPISEITNEDCMEMMKRYPDKFFDLAIVDPPYGIDVANMGYTQEGNRGCKQKNGNTLRVRKEKYKLSDWDKQTIDVKYINELKRVSKNQIIWGVNYLNIPLKGGRIIWNKLVANGVSFSDCEIAYCSMSNRVENIYFRWAGMMQGIYCGKDIGKALIQQGNKKLNEKRIHQTQKPVVLYAWLLRKYAKQGDKILDTHLGSGSSRIAAYKMGFDFYATEIDKDYFDAQEKRFRHECFGEVETLQGTFVQTNLF